MGTVCTKSLEEIKGKHSEVKIGSYTMLENSDSRAQDGATLSPGSMLFDELQLVGSRLSSAATQNTLHQFPELAARYRKVMCGDLEQRLTTKAKIIRVFTSSTFTDMAAERNALMERIYPRLKVFAQQEGYEFQVVDMRWGVRDGSTDDHSTLELCLKELKACQELSTGPNFMAFLGQKYGFRPLPSTIVASEFKQLLDNLPDQEERKLLETWFVCDVNAVPCTYVLQPISTRIPGYLSQDPDQRYLALQQWTEILTKLQNVLRREAKRMFGDQEEEKLRKYFMSVTESEIRHGVMSVDNPEKHCLWISRNIRDLENHLQDKNAQSFIDINCSTRVIDLDAKDLLLKLKDVVMKTLPSSCIRTFEVEWNSKGISPSSVPEHAEYISNLCKEVEYLLKDKITDFISRNLKGDVNDQLYDEVVEHLRFCQNKCSTFYGRKGILDRCRVYLKDDRRDAFVVYGQSGCGKTSVMSMVAKEAWNISSQSNVVIRYIGTTPNSSQIRLLLHSVCEQICNIYGRDPRTIREEIKELQEDFASCLQMATAEKPLFIFLDSLDQFGLEDNARQLIWFPLVLPDHVKLIVSTLPDNEYECFPILQSLLGEDNFVEVPKLPEKDAFQILRNWLSVAGRTLSPSQESIVTEALQKCSLPIFIRVAFDEALRWKSYSLPSETVLQDTVRGAVNALFERVEIQHGRLLVQHTLAYITASKSGLTSTEIEDLLSCDDQVLDDVYQYWTPPIRRIPPLLEVRIKNDLAGYLIDRGADGASVITWYHRQFIEAARDRYLSSEEERIHTHQGLSDYFLGVWANGRKKPYKTTRGENLEADRFVPNQPWTFDDGKSSKKLRNFNYRKISELPFHLVLCKDLETLKKEVLCNFSFLLSCLEAYSLRDLMDDFDFALQRIFDKDIQLVKETLQLSTFALLQHPAQLSSQLLGRIPTGNESDIISSLLHQARNSRLSSLLPSTVCLTSPGGPLIHSMSGHQLPISALSSSADGKLIASASFDSTCTVWNVYSGRLVRTLEGVGEDVWFVAISPDNSLLVVSGSSAISVWRLSNGQRVFSVSQEHMPTAAPICVLEKENTALLGTIQDSCIKFFDLQTGRITLEITDSNLVTSGGNSSPLCLCSMVDQTVLYASRSNLASAAGWVRQANLNTKEVRDVVQVSAGHFVHFMGVTKTAMLLLALSEGSPNSRRGSAVQTTFFTLELWDLNTNVLVRILVDPSSKVRCYALSMDNSKALTLGNPRFLASANVFQAEIKIFDLISGEVTQWILMYPSSIHLIQFIDTNHVLSASRDKIVRLWDLDRCVPTSASDESEEEIELEIVDMCGYRAVCWEKDALRVVDLQAGHSFRFVNGVKPQIALVNDSEAIIVSSGKMHLFDINQSQMIREFEGDIWDEGLTNAFFIHVKHEVVAVNSDQRSLSVYDMRTGQKTSEMHCEHIRRLVCTPNGDICVSGHSVINEADSVKSRYYFTVWDMKQRKRVQEIDIDNAETDFSEMQLAKDGSLLSDIVYDSHTRVYRAVVFDVKSGNLSFASKTKHQIHTSAILAETRNLLLGLFDGTIELCDIDNGDGQCLHRINRAHLGSIHRIYTTDDGTVAMTTAGGLDSKDRSIRFWRLHKDHVELLTVFTPDAKVSSMNISSDGHFVALEITDVVAFVLVKEKNQTELQLRSFNGFTCCSVVDLTDFKILNR
ncbi:NACHT domain- and WD repeat-containing protein 1-like isoform X2 [Montipora foliosa]|uniref:NACHT domain- and WD repeat-containing protein 1-like isoform X2 n=1 Tax=Montipora foliosa TaxID=591990 RepID=UPI0035F17128